VIKKKCRETRIKQSENPLEIAFYMAHDGKYLINQVGKPQRRVKE
jgi:hypothetical protein